MRKFRLKVPLYNSDAHSRPDPRDVLISNVPEIVTINLKKDGWPFHIDIFGVSVATMQDLIKRTDEASI